MKTKVAIVCVYFGLFPKYFEYFKYTAFFNKNYNWFIFTDQVTKIIRENNIFFIPYTFELLNKKLSDIFNTPIQLKNYNQIGDTKPLYGKLFEWFLRDYEWWGWTDLDLLNGNFDKFLNDDIFNQYDIICATNTTVHNRTSFDGPFLLCSMRHKNLSLSINDYGSLLSGGDSGGRYNAFNIEEKHFYDVVVSNNLKIYKGKEINNYFVSNVRYGKRKLPACWNNGNIELDSYKQDYWGSYVSTYGCDTLIYHLPKNFKTISFTNNKIFIV